jgi:hypothetical protein
MSNYNKVKFVDALYIKENSTIEFNVDDKKITPLIYKVQDLYLQQSLGTTFYKHLKNAVVNTELQTGTTLTNDEIDLITDYIQPVVGEYALYELIPLINFNFTNKAVSQKSSEFSQPSNLDEVKYIRNNIKNMAEFYMKRLNKYLCDNPTLFPKYQNPDPKENVKKNGRSYFSGIHMPKKSGPSGIQSYDEPFSD